MQSLSALLLAQSSSPRPSRSAPPWCWLKHECCWDFMWAFDPVGALPGALVGPASSQLVLPIADVACVHRPHGPRGCGQTSTPRRCGGVLRGGTCAVWKEVCCCGKRCSESWMPARARPSLARCDFRQPIVPFGPSSTLHTLARSQVPHVPLWSVRFGPCFCFGPRVGGGRGSPAWGPRLLVES